MTVAIKQANALRLQIEDYLGVKLVVVERPNGWKNAIHLFFQPNGIQIFEIHLRYTRGEGWKVSGYGSMNSDVWKGIQNITDPY